MLAASDLCATYGPARRRGRRGQGAPVLENVSITVARGEIVGLVGLSGSGKTTLARCLTGLLPVLGGEMTFDGTAVPRRHGVAQVPRVRGVQMAFQDPASTLNPRRKVGSILTEILRVHRLCRRDHARLRAAELLDLVGLDASVLAYRPSSLSGGMCQRVAIARALAFEPRVLVADEIVSALDASIQAQILNLIADIRVERAIGVLFVTHDLSVVSQLCDRVVVMSAGTVVEQGPTREVLERPRAEPTRRLLESVLDVPPRVGT